MNVGNKFFISDDVETIIYKLRADLAKSGIIRFKDIRISGKEVMTTCPFHKDGNESKPSFGISPSGLCHCFTCSYNGTLWGMISLLYGYTDGGKFGIRWLSKNCNSIEYGENREPFSIHKKEAKVINTNPGFTEDELDKYRYIHPYMYERGLTDEIIETFDVGYDSATDCLTFPVYDHTGNPAFIARRSVKTKFFNYPRGVTKPIYGLSDVVLLGCRKIWVVESIFNCLTLWKHYKPSVALLGTGCEEQYKILENAPIRSICLAFDPDVAGRSGARRLYEALRGKFLFSYLDLPNGKDVNDCDSFLDEIPEKLIDRITYL